MPNTIELIDAIINKDFSKLKSLLTDGLNPNLTIDKANVTPLHFAAQHNFLEAVPLLIAAGATINAKTHPEGETPLAIAKLHGHTEMVKLLTSLINAHSEHNIH
jgi:ankyrin repeat protein